MIKINFLNFLYFFNEFFISFYQLNYEIFFIKIRNQHKEIIPNYIIF